MTKEEIGNTLKNLRLKTGKTQKEVAELLGRTQQIVGHWETGYSQPDANTLFELCNIYGVSVDDAFGFNRKKAEITPHEQSVINAYKSQPEAVQQAVDRLLGINEQSKKISPIQSDIEITSELIKLAEEDAQDLAKSKSKV